MANHTIGECANCRAPYSCCEDVYCLGAIDYAKERFGIELPIADHPRLPLMGPNGCTAAPYLRPICTVHTCAIAGCGFKPKDPIWTRRYFELRERIDEISLDTWEINETAE